MTNLEMLFLSYVIITVLSLFGVIYNYLTKYETPNQRIYTSLFEGMGWEDEPVEAEITIKIKR